MITDIDTLSIVLYPHPALLQKSEEVIDFVEAKEIAKKMISLVDEHKGIGLAANQVGITIRMFVMKLSGWRDAKIYINPDIVSRTFPKINSNEGCLSYPGKLVNVKRNKIISVKYKNENGHIVKERLDGLESICFQHEFDHINGVNLADYE